ncbi:MAG: ABC transporter permease [Actinomycetota bacterium]|nr:ABC transporter permease [Actinomycetota bacterium]
MGRRLILVALLAGRNIVKSVRTPMLLAVSLVQPVVWLALFSQTFGALGATPELTRLGYHSYLSFFTPAMVVLSVLFSALQSGMATVTDISTGMMDKLATSPIPRWVVLAARVFADGVVMVLQNLIVIGVAAAMGVTVRAGAIGVVVLVAFAVAFGVVWACLSNLVALASRNAEVTMVVGFFLTLPVLFLSSAFFPLGLQPGWLQALARANPAAYVITAGQGLMNLGSYGPAVMPALVALGVTAAVLVPLTLCAFRTSIR